MDHPYLEICFILFSRVVNFYKSPFLKISFSLGLFSGQNYFVISWIMAYCALLASAVWDMHTQIYAYANNINKTKPQSKKIWKFCWGFFIRFLSSLFYCYTCLAKQLHPYILIHANIHTYIDITMNSSTTWVDIMIMKRTFVCVYDITICSIVAQWGLWQKTNDKK